MLKFTKIFGFTQRQLTFSNFASFALPKHDILSMPALSPTMTQGKILKWFKKVGDKVQPGDAIAEIETDKATMTFETQEKGYVAKMLSSQGFIALGTPLAVIAKKSDDVAQFASYQFGKNTIQETEPASTAKPTSNSQPKQASSPAKTYPKHTFLQLPSGSQTMKEGKILKWYIKPGDSFVVGDGIFAVETDKATVDYVATEKGVLAKVIVNNNQTFPIGKNVAVVVKNKQLIPQFSDFVDLTEQAKPSVPASEQAQKLQQPASTQAQTQTQTQTQSRVSGERVIASPLAKSVANERGIDLSKISGSGPNGRIIKQDVQGYVAPKVVESQIKQQKKAESKPTPKAKGFIVPENPFEQIALSSMRKTIAARLTQSKQNIPHYYITSSIQMGATNALRTDLNKNEKQNGVKISINDIIVKAMALALRDYPNVNVQWHGTLVKKFKHSDISVAVAIDGGLITPIVFRAETLGLLDIARRTKDIAKRARQGKLDPSEYVGGTSTVSNLGMFGINTVTSIINPPQATILGIGKTDKRLLVSEGGSQPYRVAEVMDIIASVDHRAVDGALAAQWLNRIKHYLENPQHMLL